MSRPRVPDFYASGRWWSSDELATRASGYLAAIDERVGRADRPCAVVVPQTTDGLALLIAGSGRPAPLPLFLPDPQFWPAGSPLFEGMPLALLVSEAALADEARRRGFAPFVLPASPVGTAGLEPLETRGFVIHTSGSTGAPKPAFRPTSHIAMGAMVRARALGLGAGDGLIGGVPFASGQGVVQVVTSMVLGGALGIVGPVDHREVLSALARPEFACWRATAHFADVLGRCVLRGTARAPRVCLVSSALAESVHRAFVSRFGVPLRGAYSSTETGAIAADTAPDQEVTPGTVGRVLPGVEVVIGERPDAPAADGAEGRIWTRSPWQMSGYGMPPSLERPGLVDGWWPTSDLGSFDAAGRLRLAGRIDDCVRTRDGRLVNLEAVAAALRELDGVRAVVVVPLAGAAGHSFGAVVETIPGRSYDAVRREAGQQLPAWALPRQLHLVPELPRLPNGKPDRLACAVLLSDGAPA